MQIESLHTHTTLSDGKLSHKEMFELASSLDIGVVAFTDHDAVLDKAAQEYLSSVKNSKTKWISGIEISAAPPKEIKGMGKGGLHVIGLFVDPNNPAIREHCAKAQAARIIRMQTIVANLKKLGFIITEEECLKASGGESVGRPHIVEALKSHSENDAVMDRLVAEMKADPAVTDIYEKMMERGAYQYPYVLFLSSDAYKPAYVEVEYAPDLDETAALIRNAGGVAIIAHYFTVKKKMNLNFIEELLSEKRIDGMETIYGLWHIGAQDEAELESEKKDIRALLQKYGSLEAGGPDAHNEEDMRKYAGIETFSTPSVGLTQKLIDFGKVERKWSSI